MNRFLLAIIFLGVFSLSISSFGQTAGDFRTFSTGVWSDVNAWERYDGSVWVNPAPNTPTSGDGVITVRHNLTFDASITVDQLIINVNRTLTIPTGVSLTLSNGAGSDLSFQTGFGNAVLSVSGRIIVLEGAVIANANSNRLKILDGGVYEHNYSTTAGVIYPANWATGSTLEFTGYTTPGGPPTGLNQNFYNFTWNCPNLADFIDLDGVLTTVNGDLAISNTNGSFLVFTQGTSLTLNVGGNFNISGNSAIAFNGFTGGITTTVNISGNFNYTSSAQSWFSVDSDAILNITGNFTVNSTAGIDLVSFANAGTGSTVINLNGNFGLTSGELKNTTNATVCDINFSGTTDSQTFSNTGIINDKLDFTIENGAYVDFGTSAVSGSGEFTLVSGSTMKVGSSAGLTTGTTSGNVQVSGNRSYNANATIIYNGNVAQVLGNEWGSLGALNGVAVNLEINNTNGVTNDIVGGANVVGTLTLTNGALNIGNSNSLDVQSDFIVTNGTIGGLSSSNLTFSGSGLLGTLSMASGSENLNNLSNSRVSTPLVLGSNLTIAGTLSLTSNLDFSGRSLTINGTSIAGTAGIIGSSTSNLTIGGSGFSGAIPFTGSSQLNDLSLSSGGGASYEINSAVIVNGNLFMNAGTLTHTSGLSMAANSTFVKDAGSIISNSPNAVSSYNVLYTASGTTSLELPSSTTALNDLTVNVGGTVTLQSTTTVNGSLVLNSGTLDASTNNLTVAGSNWTANGGTFTINAANTVTLSNAGTITMGGSSIGGTQFGNLVINSGTTVAAPAANLNVSGTWTNNGIFTAGTGTVTFNGASQNLDPNGQSFYNVTFAGTGTKNLVSALTASGTLSINAGVTLDAASSTNAINVSGSWVNNGTFTPSGNTVIFDGVNQSIDANAQPFYNLQLNGSGTKTLAGTLDVNNNLSIGSGVTLSTSGSGYAIFVGGNWTNDGTFTAGLGTVTFDGTTLIAGANPTAFRNIVIAGNVTAPASDMNVAGNWDFSSGSFTANGGTVTFNGANQTITSGAQSFNNLIISGTNSKTLQDNLDVNGNLTLNGGTLDVGLDRQINLAGNFDASGGGNFTAAAGKIVFDGLTQTANGGGVTFNSIELASTTTTTFSGNLNLTGDWNAIAGSSYSGSGTTSFTGAGTQSITSSGGSFGSVTIAGSGTKTLQDAFVTSGDLTITSTLDVGTNNLLNVAGNWDSGTGAFTAATGSVILDGASQNITLGTNSFNNLTIAGTGSKILQDALDVNGSLTISSTLDVGINNAINIVGDWTNNGTFTAASGKVTFDGNGTSNVLGSATTTFNDLDVTGSTNVEIETTHNLAGTLSLVGSSSAFDADGSGGAGIFTLVSSSDNPTTDGNIAALTTPANFTGNVTVQRYMSSEGGIWRYLATPVSGLTVADWQTQFPITGSFTGADDLGGLNNPSLYIYDETNTGTVDLGWAAYPNTTNTESISPGVGYSTFIRASAGQTTVNQRGPINKGNFNFSPSYTVGQGSSDDGWNLLGNPYPAALDWNLLYNDAGTANINPTIYIKDNGGGGGVFATFNASSGTGTNGGTKNIAQGQAFWVQANAASPSLVAAESMKTTDSHSFFRETTPIDYLRIALSDGINMDETLIHFFDDALPGKDKYDSYKIKNDIFNLSSLMDDGSDMVINAIGPLACDTEVLINIADVPEGNYTLDFSELDSFHEVITVYLTDNFTNTYTLVNNGFIYQFSVTADSASFGDSRFKVTFDKPNIDTELTVLGSDICEAEIASITVSGSEMGINYFAVKNGIGVSDTLVGNGSDLILAIQDSLANGSYEYNVIADNTCGSIPLSNSAIVNVSEIYQITQVVGDQSCGPNSALLQAAGAPADGGYRWYNNLDDALPLAETTVGEFTTPSINESQSFYVSVYNSQGCEGDRMPIEVTITNLDIPLIELDTVDVGVYKLISSYTQGNQWYLYGEVIAGANSNSLLVTEPGIYSVTVEQNGCTVTSDDYNYEDLVTGLVDDIAESLINVAPNPFTTSFELYIPAESFNLRKTVLTIYDINGKIVYFDKKVKNENISINLGSVKNGIYLLNIYDGEAGIQYKLIKE